MGRIAITRDTIKAQTISSMKKMGTFEPEYEPIIEIYAGLREQYYRLLAEYQDGKTYRYATPTADGGEKKSPLSLTSRVCGRTSCCTQTGLCSTQRLGTKRGKRRDKNQNWRRRF